MVNKIGIIQGRLTNSNGRLQCFPDSSWSDEFNHLGKVGLDYIELISDSVFNQNNPLWNGKDLDILKSKIKDLRIGQVSMTLDHIMPRPLTHESLGNQSLKDLIDIVNRAKYVGVGTVVLPLLEDASLRNRKDDQNKLIDIIKQILTLTPVNISFAIESDMDVQDQLNICNSINNKRLGLCYDTGNRSYFGYDLKEEIILLKEHIIHIHIKDKDKDGKNVMLGKGNVDFESVFNSIKKIKYKGNYTLETSRGDEEIESAILNKKFIDRCIKRKIK